MSGPIKVVVIGGSNTLMNPGWFPKFISMAADRGLSISVLENYAIGNTTIGYGFYCLLKNDALRNADVLMIEYAINDEFIYRDIPGFRHWARLYEGLIRFAVGLNPTIKIFSVILETRRVALADEISQISSNIVYLSHWYQIGFVDLSRELNIRHGLSVLADEKLYAQNDAAHYSTNKGVPAVAEIAADAFAELVRAPTYELSSPVDRRAFVSVGRLDVVDLARAQGLDIKTYKNKRFSLSTFDLAAFALRIRIKKGILLGIEFVCERNTAPFYITIGSLSWECDPMKSGVKDGTYKFLLSYMPCEFLYGSGLTKYDELNQGLIVLSSKRPDSVTNKWLPRDGSVYVRAESEPKEVFPIMGILYSGELTGYSLKKWPENTARPAAVQLA
jgi:hypothetical protein